MYLGRTMDVEGSPPALKGDGMNVTYRKQKAALTRAINSGNPHKVVEVVADAVAEWDGSAWPDDWHRWKVALRDARRRIDEMLWELERS